MEQLPPACFVSPVSSSTRASCEMAALLDGREVDDGCYAAMFGQLGGRGLHYCWMGEKKFTKDL